MGIDNYYNLVYVVDYFFAFSPVRTVNLRDRAPDYQSGNFDPHLAAVADADGSATADGSEYDLVRTDPKFYDRNHCLYHILVDLLVVDRSGQPPAQIGARR